MWISLVGTITQVSNDGKKRFDFGIRRYPELDNPVWFASEEDLDVIFEKECPDSDKTRRLIKIGKSPLFSDYDVRIDMDRFFSKHAAVLGNTGSGKSCTVTALINAVIGDPAENRMPHAHFVIFDTNAEYEAAFTRTSYDNSRSGFLYNRLVIKNDGDNPSGFWLPHWFMNGLDYQAFFRPGEGAQGPLLHQAIGIARAGAQIKSACNLIYTIMESVAGLIEDLVTNLPKGERRWRGRPDVREQVQSLKTVFQRYRSILIDGGFHASVIVYEEAILKLEQAATKSGQYETNPDGEFVETCLQQVAQIRQQIVHDQAIPNNTDVVPVGIDTPLYFDFQEFVRFTVREELEREIKKNPNIRNYIATLLMRLEQALQDPRYSFLFRVPSFPNSLASFLRLIFGVNPSENFENPGSKPPWHEEYRKQYPTQPAQHQVTILDFSQLASDVLENVTALIGRLILEFMQRCPERGKYPVVLVLEEAHRYIPKHAPLERQQRAREIFERIAKEGRKYGLSLVVASQRPGELSPTVLAQCNSFIVHRIQNPEDREYFKSVISGINRDLLDQLLALPQQYALIIGDCITVPLQVRVNDVNPKPNSKDPKFFAVWSDSNSNPPDFEAICAEWECNNVTNGKTKSKDGWEEISGNGGHLDEVLQTAT